MITRLLTGVARSLFLLACAFAALAILAGYAAVRCLKGALQREPRMPVRDATLNALTAVLGLVHVIREQAIAAERRRPAVVSEPEPEPEPFEESEPVAEVE